jgi:hypothetical protein
MSRRTKYPRMEKILRVFLMIYHEKYRYTDLRAAISSPNITESVRDGVEVHTLRVYGRMLMYLSTIMPEEVLILFICLYAVAFYLDFRDNELRGEAA